MGLEPLCTSSSSLGRGGRWGAAKGPRRRPISERKETRGHSLGLCQWGLVPSSKPLELETHGCRLRSPVFSPVNLSGK